MQRIGAFDDRPIEDRIQTILDEGDAVGMDPVRIARMVESFVARRRLGATVQCNDRLITVTLPTGRTLRHTSRTPVRGANHSRRGAHGRSL